MSISTAYIAVLTIIVVFQLLVTYGLVRRLRVHTDLLNELIDENTLALAPGTPIPAFATHTTDGAALTDRDVRHPAAIALLEVDCPHCRTNLPDFLAYVRGAGFARENVLAVVATRDSTDPAERDAMLETLSAAATLVCESGEDAVIGTALNAQAYPTFYLTDADATITRAVHAVRRLPNTTAATPSRSS
ncbi:hypothetical protein [Nocardia terpenica]|uniref:Thioredoxin domain-containing protein n=1 Tax=Nocardia terpenica TaxID=455432 RepID=A0A6G9Z5R4_9NOCA|nr:hypothetical protein [Nocardia terpenica]QIS20687.1 hypothetical protein F6W96_22640 [Nocardia terpenica]